MMDWTDRHCRYFFRLLTQDARLYTEMVTASAVLRGDHARLLGYNEAEHPLALQLGGSQPRELADAVRIAGPYAYDEINLNIGCPSDRVQSGRFGACLMAEPERVAACIAAMCDAASVPITVKTRIGIDDRDDYEFLVQFVEKVAAAGCQYFVVHARKAILAGLSPKENRSIPPLRYDVVYRLKREFPALTVVLNGGVESVAQVRAHLEHVDGVMIGRKAYGDPWFLANLQRTGVDSSETTRQDIVIAMTDYATGQIAAGARLHHISRHMLGLFTGVPGARRWRRFISESASRDGADAQLLIDSLSVFDIAA
ncbi:MAG: tRNA dihydrouridine(20/20a) synthase DusA [Gammaproteobacteria bacterium]|nr:tRNA dihydrouridine(20/20a) synthase DusA [Gammaproteobacteria bacterium]